MRKCSEIVEKCGQATCDLDLLEDSYSPSSNHEIVCNPICGCGATEYYQAPKSAAVGSVFLYVQPFIVVQGDVSAVGSVTLTLTNAQGVSDPVTVN